MKGLLYKEFCMLKPQARSWGMVMLFFIIYGVIFKSVTLLTMMIALMGLMTCFTSFSYDKQYRCDEYIAAMPVSRKKMVWSKYAFIGCMDVILVLFSLLLSAVCCLITGEALGEMALSVSSVLGVTVLMQALLIPTVYLLGVEKARYINILIWMIPWMLVMFFKDRISQIEEGQIMALLGALPFVMIAAVVISVAVSVGIYRKKDL